MEAPSLPKGHLRCFSCRKAVPAKEGSWQNQSNQQVFVCKVCDKGNKAASTASQSKSPLRR